MPTNIQSLADSLSKAKARWTARQTPQSQLSDDEKKALLGVIFTPADIAAKSAPPSSGPRWPSPRFRPCCGLA